MAKKMYEVNRVELGYKYWRKNLRNKLMNFLVFTNLPASLPSSEIMYRLLRYGFCVLFNHSKYGLVTATGGLSGVDIYGHETTFVYAQPILGSGVLTIGKECGVITATKEYWQTAYSPDEIINRYARQLADIDSTFNIEVVNERNGKLYGSCDSSVRDSLKRVIEKTRDGEFDVITEPAIIKTISEHESAKRLDVADIITARDAIIKAFWEEFGVHYTARKTERFLADELSGDSQILTSVRDGYVESVKDGIARCNQVLGCDIKVDINPAFLPLDSFDEVPNNKVRMSELKGANYGNE